MLSFKGSDRKEEEKKPVRELDKTSKLSEEGHRKQLKWTIAEFLSW